MNAGKSFEHQFQKSLLKDKFYTLRLIDPPSSFGKDSTKVRFSAKTLFCLELKSVIGTSVSFQTEEESKQKKNTSANIKWHQIKSLLEAAEYIDVNAMFIINFRKTNKTYAVPIEDFISFITSPDFNKKSINEDDCDTIGLLIPQKLNRTTYHYDFQHIYDIIYEEFYDGEDVDLGKEYEIHCESIDEDEIE